MGRIYNGMSAAKKLVMKELGYDKEKADRFIRIDLRNDLPTLRTKEGAKFIFGVTRMFCRRELSDASIINNLNTTLKLVSSKAHIEEYDRDLNGLTAQELIDRFKGVVSSNLEAEKEELTKMEFDGESDYDIVRIDSFEDAAKYANYTSWCITHDENMFDNYTADGINQFYFCLRNGFEYVPRVSGANAPLDDYGLSMIAVCVDENGMLTTCTCRWNHDNGGNDSIMNTKEISELICRNFFDVFKPNNKFQEVLDRALEGLRQEKPLKECFDEVRETYEGITPFRLGKKWNLVDANGNILCDKWYKWVYNFCNGFTIVKREDDKWNFIDTDGNILCDKWYKDVWYFYEGFARVQREDDKWNFIDTDGNILCDDGYKWVGSFCNGFARVQRNDGKLTFIDKYGKEISDKGYKDIWDFHDGFARVQREDEMMNFIDTDGKELSKEWYKDVGYFKDGFVRVQREDDKWNFIDSVGKILSKEWFEFIEDFANGFVRVQRKDGLWYLLNTQGQLYDWKTKEVIKEKE